ncbi:MAG: hypothetical protein QM674_23270, partial [Burkholderiaceae bacterium]
MGDPSGIGPEIIIKAAAALAGAPRPEPSTAVSSGHADAERAPVDLVVHGDPDCLRREAERLGLPMPARIEPVALAPDYPPGGPRIGVDGAAGGDDAAEGRVAA